jgi:hypothetical protein
MPNQSAAARVFERESDLTLEPVASFPELRVLAWQGTVLYASRGYTLVRADFGSTNPAEARWEEVALFHAPAWRRITASSRLTFRLFRDGFHALAVLPSGAMVGAVPGAIVTLPAGEREFSVTHRIDRGTRPLHIVSTPDGRVFWGEYFDNPRRDEVHIYESSDEGKSWRFCHTFAPRQIRHVHNIVYDEWENCLWILTGDYGAECRVLCATLDFSRVETVIAGNQQARAVAMVTSRDAVYFSSDTPLERNHIYRLDRRGQLTAVADLTSSSIYGSRVGDSIFFSTMVEPSQFNRDRNVRLYGGDDFTWKALLRWKKDFLPMRFFQYGNVILPDGSNSSRLLALTTTAVDGADLRTTIFRLAGTKSADARQRPRVL